VARNGLVYPSCSSKLPQEQRACRFKTIATAICITCWA